MAHMGSHQWVSLSLHLHRFHTAAREWHTLVATLTCLLITQAPKTLSQPKPQCLFTIRIPSTLRTSIRPKKSQNARNYPSQTLKWFTPLLIKWTQIKPHSSKMSTCLPIRPEPRTEKRDQIQHIRLCSVRTIVLRSDSFVPRRMIQSEVLKEWRMLHRGRITRLSLPSIASAATP